jgi:hypothetical protein
MIGADESTSRKWTVMVYMAGDNNLSDRCVDNVREMKLAELTDDVTVRAQINRSSAYGHRHARYKVTGCALENFDDAKCSISADKLRGSSRHYNTGRTKPLEDFIKWCIEDRPADNYALILWGHASPLDNVPVRRPARRMISHRREENARAPVSHRVSNKAFFKICTDDNTGESLTNIDLREVLRRVRKRIGRPIDVLGMDACLMSMIELCYDLRDGANFIVASESLIPSQEHIANMLGKDRNQVGAAASALRQKGLIRYQRGRMTILDPGGLRKASCECYAVVRDCMETFLEP